MRLRFASSNAPNQSERHTNPNALPLREIQPAPPIQTPRQFNASRKVSSLRSTKSQFALRFAAGSTALEARTKSRPPSSNVTAARGVIRSCPAVLANARTMPGTGPPSLVVGRAPRRPFRYQRARHYALGCRTSRLQSNLLWFSNVSRARWYATKGRNVSRFAGGFGNARPAGGPRAAAIRSRGFAVQVLRAVRRPAQLTRMALPLRCSASASPPPTPHRVCRLLVDHRHGRSGFRRAVSPTSRRRRQSWIWTGPPRPRELALSIAAAPAWHATAQHRGTWLARRRLTPDLKPRLCSAAATCSADSADAPASRRHGSVARQAMPPAA